MLEPEYFNYKADRVVEIYQEWEDFLMRDIANRVLKTEDMSGTVDYELWVLEQMGEHRDETLKKLSALTDMSVAALRAVLQDAVLTSWKTDRDIYEAMGIIPSNPIENPAVMKVIDAEYRKGVRELHNLTQTTMNQSQQDLIRMLDEAELRLTTGAKSAASEVCRILDEYAGHGIYVTYPSGTRRTLEAAVRMCVVTSMNQLAAAITNQYIVEHKIEYVIVSAHLGARTQPNGAPYCAGHINWQGRVYKIRGSDDYAPNLLEMTGYDIGEHGENRVADLRGLHGYNCRHSHGPWARGLENIHMDADGNPKIGEAENKARYDLEQKQRAMERAIRKAKRELLMKRQEIASVAETDVKEVLQPGYDKLAYKLCQQNKAYNEFCEKHDLPKQADRTKVSGYTRKEAAKAVGRATAYENQNISGKAVHNNKKSDIMTKESITKEDVLVHSIGKIDKEIYRCVTEDIVTDEVIITDERIEHIKIRHPNDYERFYGYMSDMIERPDYIIQANKPNTAIILKEITDNGKKFQLVLRILTSVDNPNFKNSVITFLNISERTWKKYLRNKQILYKRE